MLAAIALLLMLLLALILCKVRQIVLSCLRGQH